MATVLGRPNATPATQTVWMQGEAFITGTIGTIDTSLVTFRLPRNLPFRKIYVALGIVFTGNIVPDAATNTVEHEIIGKLRISEENVETYKMDFYHNPTPTGLVIADSPSGRVAGPWPPCVLSRPVSLDNVVPKLPDTDHPDTRFFTLMTRKTDSVPATFYHLIAKTLPIRLAVVGNNMEFSVRVNRPSTGGSTYGHLIVACESSSHST